MSRPTRMAAWDIVDDCDGQLVWYSEWAELEAENRKLRDRCEALEGGGQNWMAEFDRVNGRKSELEALRDHDHCLLNKLESENRELRGLEARRDECERLNGRLQDRLTEAERFLRDICDNEPIKHHDARAFLNQGGGA